MEGKSNFCRSLQGRRQSQSKVSTPAFKELRSVVGWRNNVTRIENPRHAEDPGVEIQGFDRIFNPQHGLLHHEILEGSTPLQKRQRNTTLAEGLQHHGFFHSHVQENATVVIVLLRKLSQHIRLQAPSNSLAQPEFQQGNICNLALSREKGVWSGRRQPGTFNSQMSAHTR